jgi:RNA polymerase sigma factor (sigma-70 family)
MEAASNTDARVLVEHLFREESGKMLAALSRLFGLGRMDVAEDIVHETFVAALRTWQFGKVPDSPSAWLMQVARNKALNELKRLQHRRKVTDDADPSMLPVTEEEAGRVFLDHEIKDSRLAMLFACCHPEFPIKSQVILTLRAVCGFAPKEIAAGMLMSEDAVAKTLVRVKKEIKERNIPFQAPIVFRSQHRQEAVLTVIYLLFNEGYKSSAANELVRSELSYEAIRLARLLTGYALDTLHETYALLALMYFNFARFRSRTGELGEPLLLKDQDRSLWDHELIAEGYRYLALSRQGEKVTRYHLEAGIAAVHCSAKNFESTDWKAVINYYDLLSERWRSPLYVLNRVIAVGNCWGPEAGLDALQKAGEEEGLGSNHLYHAALGSFCFDMGDYRKAAAHYKKAYALAESSSDRIFLEKRIAECDRDLLTRH